MNMKGLIFLCLIIFTAGTSGQLFEVNQKLRIFFDVWKSGSNELLPILDPLEVTHADGLYNIPSFSMQYVTNNIHIRGLKNFDIRSLDVSSDNLSATIFINIPLVTINADDYEINCSAFYFFKHNCYGSHIEINIYNMDLRIKIRLGALSEEIINLDSLDLGFTVDKVEVNLPECSWGLNTLINSRGKNILYESEKDVNYAVQNHIVPLANKYLNNLTFEQLLHNIDQFIRGGGIPLETKLYAFLEIWKAGTNELLLPLNPIPVPDFNDMYYETSTIRVMCAARNINIHGLNSFTINSIEVSLETSTLAAHLHVPKIIITADSYLLKGRAFFVYNFECSGNMDVTLNNVELGVLINFDSSNETNVIIDYADVTIRPTNTEVNMGSCPSTITNLVTNEINNMFKTEQETVSNFLNDQLVPFANDFFARMSLDDVLAFIDNVTFDYFKQ